MKIYCDLNDRNKIMDFKESVKRILNTGKQINPEILYSKIQDYNYISFDIFDTLVKRNIGKPMDIFVLMEQFVGNAFKIKRIEAEKRARAELGKIEVTIDDIYSFYPENDYKGALIKKEIEIEINSIVPNQPLIEVYNRCIQNNKIVFIISDMYWPKEAIKQLLDKCGIKHYRKLYLSSSEQKVKSDGSLFIHFLKKEGIKANQVIHIGDSKEGDYKQPRRLGINAIRIPRYVKNVSNYSYVCNKKIEKNYLENFINNTMLYNSDALYQFGYSQFGKLLYGYSRWIHEEIKKKGIKKLIFFARDGYIMKQAYDICFNDTETHYLEVSRRSLRVPVLWMDCSFNSILKMVVNAKLVTIESVFDGLGLDINEYDNVLERNNLKRETIFDRTTIGNDRNLKQLILDIQEEIIINSKKEYILLEKYLKKESVNGKFGVVDIGYAGSMQRYLQQTLTQLQIPHEISGFYLGVAEFYKKNMLPGMTLDLNGYLFDFQHDKDANDVRSSFVGLFETLFLEQGGSVKRYLQDGKKVQVERYPYEYIKNGMPTKDYIKIKKLQQGALEFVSKAASDCILSTMKFSSVDMFDGIYKTGTSPGKNDIQMFADIEFYDEGMTEKLAMPKSLLAYVRNPESMKSDFLRCRWKTGFLKKLLKVRLPYQKIYKMMQKIK